MTKPKHLQAVKADTPAKPEKATPAAKATKPKAEAQPKPDTKPKAQTAPSPATKPALRKDPAGPITVNASDFLIAWHNARQARQRTKKGAKAAQCVHVEWYEDRLHLVGMHEGMLLRAVVEANNEHVPEPWPTEPPYRTSLVLDDKGQLTGILKAQAAQDRAELTLMVRAAANRKQQIEGHEWQHELVLVASDGTQHVTPLIDEDPLPWRKFEPYDALGIDTTSGSAMSTETHNRLGSLRRVAQVHTHFLGVKRPLRIEGTYKDAVVLRGWVMPTSVDLADVAGPEAQVLLNRLAPPDSDPRDPDEPDEDPLVKDRPGLDLDGGDGE